MFQKDQSLFGKDIVIVLYWSHKQGHMDFSYQLKIWWVIWSATKNNIEIKYEHLRACKNTAIDFHLNIYLIKNFSQLHPSSFDKIFSSLTYFFPVNLNPYINQQKSHLFYLETYQVIKYINHKIIRKANLLWHQRSLLHKDQLKLEFYEFQV